MNRKITESIAPSKESNIQASKRFKGFPLRLILVLPFVVQIVGAVGLVGYLSFKNGEQAVRDLADQLMDKTTNLVDEHLNTYLQTPHQLNQLNINAIEKGLLNIHDFRTTEQVFWQQLKLYNVSYINYALVTGEFLGVGYLPLTKNIIIDEITSENRKQGLTHTYITDSQGNPFKLLETWNFDPHQEAWYADTAKAGKAIWSSIYTWDTPEGIINISISASYPFYDKNKQMLGVLGIDLSLRDISNYLNKLQFSSSGKVFIIERNGLLVATSSNEKLYNIVNSQVERLNALNSSEPLIKAAIQYLTNKFSNYQAINNKQKLNFQFQGESQFLHVSPWKDQYGLDWLIVTVVPESDFMTQINANNQTTIILCLLALIIAIGLGLITSRWITQPILRLGKASVALATATTEELASGDLDQQIEVKGIVELGILSYSFNEMAQQLQASFNNLARTNQELDNVNQELEKANEELETRVKERTAELQLAKNTAELANRTKSEFLAHSCVYRS